MKIYLIYIIFLLLFIPITSAKQSENYLVTKIIDGDTIEIETGQRVRLICINTPEKGENGYKEATQFLNRLLKNKRVKLVSDTSDRDKYGRLLRYVYIDNIFVNKEIVKEGFGVTAIYKPDTKKCGQIKKAEDISKKNRKGIWAALKQDKNIGIICTSNVYNCKDFKTQAEAQHVFDFCKNSAGDIHKLDGSDKDGIVCEFLKS